MYLEGVRFLIAVGNSLDVNSVSVLSDVCCDVELDGTPYYNNIIRVGNLDIEEVASLRKKYEHQYGNLLRSLVYTRK